MNCDAELYSPQDDEISLGACGDAASHDVLCTDGRWHPRCGKHVPAVVAGQANRVRPLGGPLDCRSEEGILVGLVDGMIAQSRVLARALRTFDESSAPVPEAIKEALADLRTDEDVALVVGEKP